MKRVALLFGLMLLFTGEAMARPKVGLGARLKHAARKAGIFIAPVRVARGADGSVALVRWGVSRRGNPVPKELEVQLPDGSRHASELSYRMENGRSVLQRKTTHGSSVAVTTKRGTAFTKTVLEHRGDKPLTRPRAYFKAVKASPLVHFLATTGFFYLFWEVAPRAVGVHLEPMQAATAALATKAVTLPVVTWKAVQELKLRDQR